MFCRVLCADICGIEAKTVFVEADVSGGLPGFYMVGLPSSEVKEAKERVLRAIYNSGIDLPPRKITINLSPANMRKSGSGFDLPIAMAILGAYGYVEGKDLDQVMIAGELSLDGKINPIHGVLPIALTAAREGMKKLLIPEGNLAEGAVVGTLGVFGAPDLRTLLTMLQSGEISYEKEIDLEPLLERSLQDLAVDFSEVKGQEVAKRATLVAVAGFHHLLYVGPPGSGKSMMARRIPTILNKLTSEECMELSRIYSVAGLLGTQPLLTRRPFRAPHHTITVPALVGGYQIPRPGEISLAHKGVLFLDEAAEFKKETIETLRIPLETKQIVLNRLSMQAVFPADFMLVMAMNPCRCGYYPDRHFCHCSEADVQRYFGKIKGPILDRIDVCVGTKKLNVKELRPDIRTESSAEMREKIIRAQKRQEERFRDEPILFNSQMGQKEIEQYCKLDPDSEQILDLAYEKYNMSARGYMKVLKVARTIADLSDEEQITKDHVMEALSYRNAFVEGEL
ncbi:MAG: YifB family Mg chelatase-like AAA ATPase [Lachnospiraceae bacterium]|nr:YifB family Mg chelatase-like AAA ATPase [Lachnospiraceae bacterium]